MEIRVRGVKAYRNRHGKVYAYHRATGTRIAAVFGSAAFLAEVETLNDRQAKRQAETTRPGSWGSLVLAYKQSPEFTQLAPRTRHDYQQIFDYLRPLADDALVEFKPATVLDIRDAAFRAHKRRFANYVVAVLRLLFKWGVLRELLAVNPAIGVAKLRRPRSAPKANRAWNEDECRAVLDAAKGGLKLAVALGMFACMREGDMVAETRPIYDGAWLCWHQNKTGALVEVPVDPRLKTLLDLRVAEIEGDRLVGKVVDLTLVLGERGKPYTEDGFRTMFFRLVKDLEAAKCVRPGLTFHGLRHTAGKTLAELGADPRTIAALLGQKTLAMAQHYSDEANRKKLARVAIAKLRPKGKR